MRFYPKISFWISITLVKIYICCIIINWGKNNFEFVVTVLNNQIKMFLPSRLLDGCGRWNGALGP